ncbi:polysaccharide deacetylase family protein [Haliea sp. E17]|uniref:polysaccharide deacetylase family protein n=1 Tax=Haliea sp. E17 TaxID=3401576 RepID=UPI003AABF2E7
MKHRLACRFLFLLLTPLLQAAVVLQYHHISDDTPASTSTSPARFAMHLDYLQDAQFNIVPLQELVDALRAGQPLPDRTAAITFDDGYISIYDTAWPLLRARGWPFTVFVNTEPHDQNRPLYMSWEQLRELKAAGATIANHGVSHPHLLERQSGEDQAAWLDRIGGEITVAQQRITAETGDSPRLFAYPYGEYDKDVLELVASLGYAGFGQQSGPLAVFSDLRVLPRFPFGGSFGDRQDFATKVNSLPMPLAPGTEPVLFRNPEGPALDDIVLDGDTTRPVLLLQFARAADAARVNCFVSGQGATPVQVEKERVLVQAVHPLPPGRARYNCTAVSGQNGRFYWYSQPWIID